MGTHQAKLPYEPGETQEVLWLQVRVGMVLSFSKESQIPHGITILSDACWFDSLYLWYILCKAVHGMLNVHQLVVIHSETSTSGIQAAREARR